MVLELGKEEEKRKDFFFYHCMNPWCARVSGYLHSESSILRKQDSKHRAGAQLHGCGAASVWGTAGYTGFRWSVRDNCRHVRCLLSHQRLEEGEWIIQNWMGISLNYHVTNIFM